MRIEMAQPTVETRDRFASRPLFPGRTGKNRIPVLDRFGPEKCLSSLLPLKKDKIFKALVHRPIAILKVF
jgi:hypothetical protein